jgi:outer membrane protein assembly factor BamB
MREGIKTTDIYIGTSTEYRGTMDSEREEGWRGQSSTIGVVFLAAVALILVAVVGAFVLGAFESEGEPEPVLVDINSELRGTELRLSHRAGDELDPQKVSVLVDGASTTKYKLADLSGVPPDERFSAGDAVTFTINPSDPQFASGFSVIVVQDSTNKVLHTREFPAFSAALFEFESTTFPSAVDAGETATVDFEVNNTGDTAGAATIALRRNGTRVNTTSVSLTPEAGTATGSLSYTATDSDAPAVRLALATGDDTAAANVTVNAPVFEVTTTTFPEDVAAGNDSVVGFTVENTGSASGTRTVELRRNGSAVNTTSVSLSPGGTVSRNLSYQTTAGDTPAIRLTVDTGDDTAEGVVNVTGTGGPTTVYVGSNDGNLYALNATPGASDRELWNFSTGGPVKSSPTVADGTVYVGSNSSTVYAVDAAAGTEEWAFTAPSAAVISSPTVVGDTVYIGSNDGSLYALNATDGSEEWNFSTGSAVVSSPTVVNGTVYVGADDGNLYARQATTGAKEWTFSGSSSLIRSSPTVAGTTVYVGSFDGTLYAVDTSTGTGQWSASLENPTNRSSPTVEDGIVYIGGTLARELFAIDTTTENRKWGFDDPQGRLRSSPTVQDGVVYIGNNRNSNSGALFAVNASDGTERWNFTETENTVMQSSPTVADGTVYIGSNSNNVSAVNATTGDKQWQFSTNGKVISSPTVVFDPQSGDSVGSRVQQRTLGHHDG